MRRISIFNNVSKQEMENKTIMHATVVFGLNFTVWVSVRREVMKQVRLSAAQCCSVLLTDVRNAAPRSETRRTSGDTS